MVYNKSDIKSQLTIEDIYDLLVEWGGEPIYIDTGLLASTICHNRPGEGSRKLYYYKDSQMFHCYTGCQDSFDIFDLCSKVMNIQHHLTYNLNDAVMWIAYKFNLSGKEEEFVQTSIKDQKIFERYSNIDNNYKSFEQIILPEYDKIILDKFNYHIKITPWLEEGISQQVLEEAKIGFYPLTNQITIPHYDINNRFIGLRGRSLSQEDCAAFGKYRPMKINNILYNHPLGLNLYNLNNSKHNISQFKKAIVMEGEKSCLKYRTFFGSNADISVACCGSNLSLYQINLLQQCGAEEIIIAFDRQFKEIGDEEFLHLKKNLLNIRNKAKNTTVFSFIFDKQMLTDYKSSPVDHGKDIFYQLYKDRIYITD